MLIREGGVRALGGSDSPARIRANGLMECALSTLDLFVSGGVRKRIASSLVSCEDWLRAMIEHTPLNWRSREDLFREGEMFNSKAEIAVTRL